MKSTEKTTKEVEVSNEEFYDDDVASDNYYIEKALGNIKDDPGSRRSRPKRIPIYMIQLEDKDKIPKMPEKIFPKPDDEKYQKKIDELKEKSNAKKKSIQELFEKLKQEKMGIKSDDKNNVFNRKKEILTQIEELNNQIKAEENDILPIRKKFNDLSDKVKSYEKYYFGTNLQKLGQEFKKIQEKLSFGEISVSEENELRNKKNILDEYQKVLSEFQNFKKENNEKLNKTKEPRQKRKELYEQLNKIKEEIDSVKNKKQQSEPEINNILSIINSLKQNKKEINAEIGEVYKEWDDKWYEYEEQQELINYIKKCQAKLKNLEKREKKRLEEKKEQDAKDMNLKEIKAVVGKKTEKELKLQEYDNIKDYFTAMLPKKEETKIEETKKEEKSGIAIDIEKGKLQKLVKEDSKLELEFGGQGKKGKKGKKPKEPKDKKNNQKKSSNLVLDFDIIQRVTQIGLTPPTQVENLEEFLKELAKKRESFEKGEIPEKKIIEEKKEETKIEETKKDETEKEETKKEETKKVIKKEPRKEEKKVLEVEEKKNIEEKPVEKKVEEKKEETKEETKNVERKAEETKKVEKQEKKKENEEEEDDEEEEEEEDDEEEAKKEKKEDKK